MALVTQTEYARHIGKSKQYVSKLVKKGKIPLVDGLIDPDMADVAKKKNSDPSRVVGVEVDQDHSSFSAAKTKREIIRSQFEEMKFKRHAGELVEVSDIESVLKDVFRDLRDRILSIPTTVKGRLVGMTDEREIQLYLNEQFHTVLEDVSNRAFERVDHVRSSQ